MHNTPATGWALPHSEGRLVFLQAPLLSFGSPIRAGYDQLGLPKWSVGSLRSSANCSIGHRVRVTDDHCKSVADMAAAFGFSNQFSYTHCFKRSTSQCHCEFRAWPNSHVNGLLIHKEGAGYRPRSLDNEPSVERRRHHPPHSAPLDFVTYVERLITTRSKIGYCQPCLLLKPTT